MEQKIWNENIGYEKFMNTNANNEAISKLCMRKIQHRDSGVGSKTYMYRKREEVSEGTF